MTEYSIETCKSLEKQFKACNLYRPMRISRYDAGTELVYEVKSVSDAETAEIHLVIENFIGGGFAGQVYKVKIVKILSDNKFNSLSIGQTCAMKIMIPPSGFARFFRNLLYWIGFQGPFQLQVNPTASRTGALWQKFIRQAAKIRFGDEKAVVDIYATLIDKKMGSCGELSEWIEGRTWQLEVDNHLNLLKKWFHKKKINNHNLGSPEYRAKYKFMNDFVKLLHDIGGYEFARQYEWSTLKSQPNCLKRSETEGEPSKGLVAVDFRAGLVLLPLLPMSPGDFKLIFKGILRGSLVQFDRGNIKKLEEFINKNSKYFKDMHPMLEELKSSEKIYRNSLIDITHNHIKIFFSRYLWSTILESSITGWKTQNLIDEKYGNKLEKNKFVTLLFLLISFVPFLGKFILKFSGRADWHKHYFSIFKSLNYFGRAIRGIVIEKVINWHRHARINKEKTKKIANSIFPFFLHFPLSILPAGLHRFLTDWTYFKERLSFLFLRPVRLYFNAELREQWLREMVIEGQKKHMLSEKDAKIIHSRIKEPFIQKYLKSLAVHICTLPITQIVSVIIAVIYITTHPEIPRAQAWGVGLGIIALFQVIPISPGSLVRGLYVLFLVIKERDFRNYNIAVFLGFFKYIGYLAFPIQMTYHYPTLARFMAAHWATEVVHIIPVFGEQGALLEHWVFNLFYNWPLTIRRQMSKRALIRVKSKPRYWHAIVYTILATAIFGVINYFYLQQSGKIPELKDIWWFVLIIPLILGTLITLGCRGAKFSKRITVIIISSFCIGIFYSTTSYFLGYEGSIVVDCIWKIFLFSIFSVIGALITELNLGEPKRYNA